MDMWSDMKRIHSFVEMSLSSLIGLVHVGIQWTMNMGEQCMQNEHVQAFALCSLMAYSKTMVQLERTGQWFYDQNQIVRAPVDAVWWLREHIAFLLSNRKLEPNSPYWMNVCRLTIPNDRQRKTDYFETYNVNPYPHIDEMQLTFGDTFTSVNTKDYVSQSAAYTDDTIIILKTETLNQTPVYKVVLCNGLARDIPDVTNLQLSRMRLLSVGYNHPMLKEPILLEIPREMLVVGNELLSPVFVRRCLEYQGYGTEFRLDYWIHVIDGAINQYRLSNMEFLWIGVDGVGVGSLVDHHTNASPTPETEHVVADPVQDPVQDTEYEIVAETEGETEIVAETEGEIVAEGEGEGEDEGEGEAAKPDTENDTS